MADFIRFGPLHDGLRGIAGLADAELKVGVPGEPGPSGEDAARWVCAPIGADGLPGGLIAHPVGGGALLAAAGEALRSVLEHACGREVAIADFAGQLCVCYEELNLIYTLLQTMATKVNEGDIGAALVAKAAETLNCRRVSLLTLDENQECLRVLASCGLPEVARRAFIPVRNSIAGRVLAGDSPFFIEDICHRPDLAELSRGSYETSIFAVIRVPLRAQGRPVGVLTATERNDHSDFTSRDCKLLEGMSAMGAASLMHCRLQRAIQEQMVSTIRALAHAVDAKDHYTHSHSGRVSHLCVAAARHMGITDAESLRRIELVGLLHDIGKIAIPDAILGKATKLTFEEFDEAVKTHVRIGADIVGNVRGLEDVATAILHHHERYDGQGYPDGLSGEDIPLISRLVAVADTFDAMTSDRPYRKALSLEEALAELDRCRGTQLDPVAVAATSKALLESSTVPPAPALAAAGPALA